MVTLRRWAFPFAFYVGVDIPSVADACDNQRNALKYGLSIPVNRDKTLRRQIEVLARILAQSEAGNEFGQARAAAEAHLELARARAGFEAVLTRAGITAEWNGGSERGAALVHVLSELQRLERYERRAFSRQRRALRDL